MNSSEDFFKWLFDNLTKERKALRSYGYEALYEPFDIIYNEILDRIMFVDVLHSTVTDKKLLVTMDKKLGSIMKIYNEKIENRDDTEAFFSSLIIFFGKIFNNLNSSINTIMLSEIDMRIKNLEGNNNI